LHLYLKVVKVLELSSQKHVTQVTYVGVASYFEQGI